MFIFCICKYSFLTIRKTMKLIWEIKYKSLTDLTDLCYSYFTDDEKIIEILNVILGCMKYLVS